MLPRIASGAPAQLVAPRFRRQVDDAAVEASELGRRAVALGPELLDRVYVGEERDLSRLGLEHRDAVEEILVGPRPSAVDARQRSGGRWRYRHAGRQARQRDEAPAVQR